MRRTNSRSNWCMKGLAIALICSILMSGTVVFSKDIGYVEKGQEIGPGTYYKNMIYDTPNGKFVINMVEAELGTEYLKLEVSDAGKPIINQTVLNQALKKSSTDKRVISGVNGDFFDMTLIKGLPYSTSIIDGEIKAAVPSCSALLIKEDGSCALDKLNFGGTVGINENFYNVTSVNKLRWNDQLTIYTPSYGTSTKNTTLTGTDLIVKGVELPLKESKQYTGVIEQVVANAADTVIPADGVVISGNGKAAEFLNSAVAGGTISFSLNFDKTDIKYAVAGSPRLLENGQLSPDISTRPDGVERHPRTLIGLKGNKLFMVTVDGRQPGVSDGMTLTEAAEYLLSQGVENAMNFDGGGSTTMVVRTQGTVLPHVVNVPSDGRERAIGNTLLLISEAPVSQPAYVKFNQDPVKIFINSTFKPTFFVLDQYYNLVQQAFKDVKYLTDGKTAKAAKDGTYTSGGKAGASYIDVAAGGVTGRLPVTIVDKVAKIELANDFLLLDPGEKTQLNLKAYDEAGKSIIINPSAVKWNITGGVGTVDKNGVFTAGKKLATGTLGIKIGNTAVSLGAKVGKTPIVLSGFEKADGLEAKTVKSALTLKSTVKGEPVKSGKAALKLDYKFKQEDNSGTSVAYTVFKQPLKVVGKPIEIGMWVYGDASNHWIRGVYTNAGGEKKVVNFTEEGGLNWKGWKFVYTELPKDEKFPISVEQIYLAEPQKENKNNGKLYIDDLTAIYKYTNDYYSPEIEKAFTSETSAFEVSPKEFTFDVFEKGSGLNKASVKLYLDDKLLPASRITITKIDPDTERITYKIAKPLGKDDYTIRLALKDKAGNTLNPEYKTKFTVKK